MDWDSGHLQGRQKVLQWCVLKSFVPFKNPFCLLVFLINFIPVFSSRPKVVDLHFDKSPASFPVEGLEINGKNISHAEYFKTRKNIVLQYPKAKPLLEVLGRRKQTIFLPGKRFICILHSAFISGGCTISSLVSHHYHCHADTAELCCGDELDRRVKEMLPSIASYTPERRNQAIEEIKGYLIPGKQKTKNASGLLPACGIVLSETRLQAKATVLPVPVLIAAGVPVPQRYAENWAPALSKATFNLDSSRAVKLSAVVFYSAKLRNGHRGVYNTIRNLVNGFHASYMFGEHAEFVETGMAHLG